MLDNAGRSIGNGVHRSPRWLPLGGLAVTVVIVSVVLSQYVAHHDNKAQLLQTVRRWQAGVRDRSRDFCSLLPGNGEPLRTDARMHGISCAQAFFRERHVSRHDLLGAPDIEVLTETPRCCSARINVAPPLGPPTWLLALKTRGHWVITDVAWEPT